MATMTSLGDELLLMSDRLSAVAARADDSTFGAPLKDLMKAADTVAQSWSRSNMGFHADVYYRGFQPPPPGAHFSAEWGFLGMFQGTTGDWQEYPRGVVTQLLDELSGAPDTSSLEEDAQEARRIVDDTRDNAVSLLSAYLRTDSDEYLRRMLEDASDLRVLTLEEATSAQLRQPSITRDMTALGQGLRSAPHQEVAARAISIRAPFEAASRLSTLCRNAARHLERIGGKEAPTRDPAQSESRVVIGHGNSPLWRELKDFIADRLGLRWDEFNRISAAGVATTDRLQQMLDGAKFALLVATAEDEIGEGQLVARQNVVHEIGLFQAHLGLGRAIVLLEEGCEEFSNIHGLGQIRFPKGRISAVFEDVRMVLEREGLI